MDMDWIGLEGWIGFEVMSFLACANGNSELDEVVDVE